MTPYDLASSEAALSAEASLKQSEGSRIVCQFSCGAASAVATKLSVAEYGNRAVIVNAFIQEEHPDNRRFLKDCERWIGRSIIVLQDRKYAASTHEVWKRKRFIKGAVGAPCSFHLKRDLLDAFREPGDKIVIGFTVEELDRFENLQDRLKDFEVLAPLIEKNLTKADCLAIIERAGIELPAMYRLGFHNANCIGCPKGGSGYWNKIREVFPEQFIQIANIQESIGEGAKFLRNRRTGERIWIRELDPDHGQIEDEPAISCSFFCELAEQDLRF